ncbi:hypothetical protein FACS1894195_0570 [Bacteroidia bacterium]|nr:hypothetical protein FACS1894195_0570 [Bacteroidia bacterium]
MIMVRRFMTNPIFIEAIQYTEKRGEGNVNEIREWLASYGKRMTYYIDTLTSEHPNSTAVFIIHRLDGSVEAQPGDWIIRGVDNEFYPCKPDIFSDRYIEVEQKN